MEAQRSKQVIAKYHVVWTIPKNKRKAHTRHRVGNGKFSRNKVGIRDAAKEEVIKDE